MGMAVSSSPPLVFFTETAYTRNSLHYFFTFKPDLRFIIEHIFFHTFLLFRKAFRVFGCLTCILNRIYIRGQDIYRPRNRHICVLQWEEIKTKNSGATHHFWGKRAQELGGRKYIAILFSILTRKPKIIVFALTWFNSFFLGL